MTCCKSCWWGLESKMASMQESHSVAWGTCYGVGVGPGDPELLTLRAARVIGACQVVAAPQTRGGATLALDIAAQAVDLEGKDIIRLPFAMSRDAGERQRMHEESVGLIAEQLAQGKDVAVLTLGDPGFFSSFFYLADDLRDRGFAIEVIPGVTSFSAVAARLGEGLTEMDEPLHVVPSAACVEYIDEVLDLPGTKVLMKPCGRLGELIEALERRGELPCASLVADCGLPSEHVCRDLASFDPAEHPSYFTTLVVK